MLSPGLALSCSERAAQASLTGLDSDASQFQRPVDCRHIGSVMYYHGLRIIQADELKYDTTVSPGVVFSVRGLSDCDSGDYRG